MKGRKTMSITIGNTGGTDVTLDVGQYPDKTPVVDLVEAWNYVGFKPDFMIARPSSMDEFVTAMMVADSFVERGGRIKNLIIPCIPGGRQDRLKWEGDWLFTLKFVAKMINERKFDRVVTIDPHSMATTALIDRLTVHEIHLPGEVSNLYSGIIAPDLGAEKRAAEHAKKFRRPVFQATKNRDPKTNKLSGFKFIDTLIPDSRYLVVDDLCDAGGTFVGLAQEAAKVYGVRLDLFVTHGLFTKGTEELLKHYNTIYTTNSVDQPRNTLVRIIDVLEGMTEIVA